MTTPVPRSDGGWFPLLVVLAAGCGEPGGSETGKPHDTGQSPDSNGETAWESDSRPETGSGTETADDTSDSSDSEPGLPVLIVDSTSLGSIVGSVRDAAAGQDLPLAAADFDGDGHREALVGLLSAADSECEFGAHNYLFPMPMSGEEEADSARATFCADTFSDLVARSVAAAGDVDGDGLGDILIGAPEYDSIGRTYLVAGGAVGFVHLGTDATATLIGHEPDDSSVYDAYSGWAVAGAGDIDGDGLADIVVSEPNNSYVYVLNGPVTGTIDLRTQSDAQLIGDNRHIGFGYAVDSAGDVDGDGLDDVLVGNGYDFSRQAWLFAGPLVGAIDSDAADATFGPDGLRPGVVRGMGDLNGDGYADVAMTSGYERTDPDGVVVFEAPFASTLDGGDAVAWIGGRSDDLVYGLSFSTPGDFDGDGATDLAVNYAEQTAEPSGSTALVFGPFAGTMDLDAPPLLLVSSDPDDDVGTSLAAAGDADGDGFTDLLVSAGNDDTYGKNTGKVWLLSGATMSAAAGR